MISFLSIFVVFASLCQFGFSQQSGPTSAQGICDSMGVNGLYPNPDDTTCKQYAKCYNSGNAIAGAFYNCTGSTLFNPMLQYCTTGYACTVTTTPATTTPATITPATTTPATTTPATTTPATTTPATTTPETTTPATTTPATTTPATTTPATTTPATTTPATTTPETTTTVSTTETTTSATTAAPATAQSVCDSQNIAGLYPNPDDKSCKQYAKCFPNNGSLTGSFYNCTGATLFNPNLQLCSIGYVCGA